MNTELLNKEINVYYLQNYFVMLNGELTEVVVQGTKYFVDGDYSAPIVKLPDNSTVVLPKGTELYPSIADYENSEDGVCSTTKYHLRALIPFRSGSYWLFKDGEPVKITPCIETVTIFPQSRGGVLINDKPMPDEWYENREEAIKWNDYVVVDADGNKRTQKSKLCKLLPTDEQKQLIEKLKDTFTALQESGVRLVFDLETYAFDAFNMNEVKEYEFSDFHNDDAFGVKDTRKFYTGISSDLFSVPCYEDTLFIKEWKDDE